RIAGDAPLLGHVLAVVAHRLAGAGFGDTREIGFQFAQAETLERGELLLRGLRARGLQQAPPQGLAVDDRHVGSGVAAATDANLDLPGRDLVADGDDRVERSAAGALEGDAGRQRRQSRRQRRFAADVPVAGVLDHRAHRDFAELLSVQPEFLDQRAKRAYRHAKVADVGVGRVLPAERDADTAEHGNGTTLLHRITSRTTWLPSHARPHACADRPALEQG